MWQTLALAAYNQGQCPVPKAGLACFHYTDSTKFNLNDTRPTLKGLQGTTAVDTGDIWIVWDNTAGPNVWVYIKVDSIVGDRCFFASPRCNITAPTRYNWATAGNKISAVLWGNDAFAVPPAVQTLFAGRGLPVNTAATDIRPEDALFEQCRVNSRLGNGVAGGGFGDGLDGLGYNPNNHPGVCPLFGATLKQLVGTPVSSGIAGSTATANVLAFNILGHDPFTDNPIVAGTSIDVGADPIVFVFSRSSSINTGLSGASNATDAQLQAVFSGDNCDASEFGLASAPIDVYLREPLSGTMTTTEMSVFRRPTKTVLPQAVLGESQEKGVGAAVLKKTACAKGGGTRTRGIGTGEVVNGNDGVGGVLNSGGANNDGIAYSFFSFGNFSSIADNPNYGYLTLDGVDPIGAGTVNQELPACSPPCTEASVWGSAGSSFPQLRAGKYTAWSLLRLVTVASVANITALVNRSQAYVAGVTPDYIPALAVSGTNSDPGLQIFHSHFHQRDGNDALLGLAPSNGLFNHGNPTGRDSGGDAGGCTIATAGITPTTDNNFIQTGPGVSLCTKDRD